MTTSSSEHIHAIEKVIRDIVLDVLTTPDPPTRGRGRPAVLTTAFLWMGMVVSMLRKDCSQRSIWHVVSEHGAWGLPPLAISDDCIYWQLAHHGAKDMEELFTLLTAALPEVQPSLALLPTMTDIVALDCSTLAPAHYADGECMGKISSVFDIRQQRFRQVFLRERWTENEKATAPALISSLQPGSLILIDRGYFGYALFDQIASEGKYWLTRETKSMSYDDIQVRWQDDQGNEDAVGWLGKYRADQAATPIRRITVMHGKVAHVYITNILDEQVLAYADVPDLYGRRWDVERAFSLIKEELGLNITWSEKWPVVQAQVWGVLAIAQVALWFRAWVAEQRHESIFDCSLSLLLKYLPLYLENGRDPMEVLVRPGPHGGIFRPSRRRTYSAPVAGQYLPLDDRYLTPRKPRYGHK